MSLLTHHVVREDAQILFGFGSSNERDAFRQLIRISGVGPRTALGILSCNIERMAVQEGDAGRVRSLLALRDGLRAEMARRCAERANGFDG